MREPVDRSALHQALAHASVGPYPGDLRVPTTRREGFGVEVQPLAVGRVFWAIAMPGSDLDQARGPAARRHRHEAARFREIASVERHVGELTSVGAYSVQEMEQAVIRRDAGR